MMSSPRGSYSPKGGAQNLTFHAPPNRLGRSNLLGGVQHIIEHDVVGNRDFLFHRAGSDEVILPDPIRLLHGTVVDGGHQLRSGLRRRGIRGRSMLRGRGRRRGGIESYSPPQAAMESTGTAAIRRVSRFLVFIRKFFFYCKRKYYKIQVSHSPGDKLSAHLQVLW